MKEGRSFNSVLAAEGEVWASAVDYMTKQAWLYRSLDLGESWEEWRVALDDYPSPPEVELLEKHSKGVWFRVIQTLTDDLWTLDSEQLEAERLYRSDTKIMSAVQLDGETVVLSLWDQGLGELVGGQLTLVPDTPKSYRVRRQGETLYAATRPLFTGQGLMTADNSFVFEESFSYSELGAYPTCSDGTHSSLFCEPLWESLSERLSALEPVFEDTGDPNIIRFGGDTGDAPESGGCWSSGSKQAGLLVLLPFWFRRRASS
jgi:hypothetical protein